MTGAATRSQHRLLSHFHSAPKGADFRQWNSAAADRLLDAGRAAADTADRQRIYWEYQIVMAEEVPTIMLFGADWLSVVNDRVANFNLEPTGSYTRLAKSALNRRAVLRALQ